MRVAAVALIGLIALLAALLGAARPAHADAPPDAGDPPVERWSADPRLWLALIEWRQRLRLELASSRELCTAGTLTEISWQISGGTPPYSLQVEGAPVNADTDNIRINCGVLSEAEATDEDAALAAKRISAVVTDARGVRREATIEVARARALPAPEPRGTAVQRTRMATDWVTIGGAHHEADVGWWLMRWRSLAESDSGWTYVLVEKQRVGNIEIAGFDGLSEGSSYAYAVATLRAPIEQETPDALVWSSESEATTSTTPTGVRATSTHDTIIVSWDDQPSVNYVAVDLIRADGVGRSRRVIMRRHNAVVTNQVTHTDLEPETEYEIDVSVNGDGEAQLLTTIRATTVAAPTDWQPPARGAQNLSVTATHDTIIVTWDAPIPNTRDRWIVYVEHSSWRRPYSHWVSAPLTFTLEGLTPETTYTVTVAHLDLYGVEVSTTITTTPAPVQGQSSPGYPADPRLWLALIEWRQRLRLELKSSRELCTAGTLTEISWQIAGGKPPYKLQVEGSPINADADNIHINCGALSEAEAADEDAALAAKRITATVTDARGVRREAALDVARARALPAPTGITAFGHRTLGGAYWSSSPTASPDLQPVNYMVRWRIAGSDAWTYDAESVRGLPNMRWNWGISDLSEGTQYELAIAALRDQIEQANPEALQWSADMPFATAAPPQNVVAVSTHNTITVTWDAQPGDRVYSLYASGPHGGKGPSRRSANADTHQAVFTGLSPDTEFAIQISVVMTEGQETGTSTVVRTKPAPPNWQPLPSKPKNLRTTATHNSITAEWNAPHDQADGWYLVSLFDAATGQKVGRPVTIDRTSVIFLDLLPNTRYEVEITHLGIVHGRVTRVVTTSASDEAGGVTGEPRPLPGFLPAQE